MVDYSFNRLVTLQVYLGTLVTWHQLGNCCARANRMITEQLSESFTKAIIIKWWVIMTRRFCLCFLGSVIDNIRPWIGNLQYDYTCWQDCRDKNSIKGPAIIQRCQFYTVTPFKIASVTQHCFLHSSVALEGYQRAVSLGRPFNREVAGKRTQAHETSVTYVSSCLGCTALAAASFVDRSAGLDSLPCISNKVLCTKHTAMFDNQ